MIRFIVCFCKKFTPLAAGALRAPLKRRGGLKMLKWVDYCGGKFPSQNEEDTNVKIGNLGWLRL